MHFLVMSVLKTIADRQNVFPMMVSACHFVDL